MDRLLVVELQGVGFEGMLASEPAGVDVEVVASFVVASGVVAVGPTVDAVEAFAAVDVVVACAV